MHNLLISNDFARRLCFCEFQVKHGNKAFLNAKDDSRKYPSVQGHVALRDRVPKFMKRSFEAYSGCPRVKGSEEDARMLPKATHFLTS